MRSELLELAARCEGAEGADREIDALIVTTLCPGATVSEYVRGEGDDIVFHAEALGIRNKDCCPWYTHSLDAAMTLIPAQYRLGTLLEFDGDGRWAAKLFNRGKPGGLPAAGGSSAALALVSASLRALAAQGEG